MTKLNEILDPNQLQQELDDGFVRAQSHPEFPHLSIYNYTEKAQFERHWNDVTRVCRGLIVDTETSEVLARPFPKIHNFDEAEAPRIVDDQVLYHWDNKWDGSLGIVYRRPDGEIAMATRGSFASEQAVKGTEMLRGLHPDDLEQVESILEQDCTPLYEIIYPENRIVLDYEGEEFLAPLGYILNEDGAYYPGETVQIRRRTMHNMLMDLSRENSEGWVAWLTPYKAVKIKQADYVELHRIVTGLSKKEVWRWMRDDVVDERVAKVPDEFYRTIADWQSELEGRFHLIRGQAVDVFKMLKDRNLPTRKDQAEWVNRVVVPEFRGLVFMLLDGKNIDDAIIKMIEPKGGVNDEV